MSKRWLVCSIILIAALASMVFIFNIQFFRPYINEEDNKEIIKQSSIVLQTVAHLSESNFPEYTRVWFDEETDRAIYIKNNYTPTNPVDVGDKVILLDMECLVSDFDEQGIIIRLPGENLAKHGMSGSQVFYKDVSIALVSKAVGLQEIYCILL